MSLCWLIQPYSRWTCLVAPLSFLPVSLREPGASLPPIRNSSMLTLVLDILVLGIDDGPCTCSISQCLVVWLFWSCFGPLLVVDIVFLVALDTSKDTHLRCRYMDDRVAEWVDLGSCSLGVSVYTSVAVLLFLCKPSVHRYLECLYTALSCRYPVVDWISIPSGVSVLLVVGLPS